MGGLITSTMRRNNRVSNGPEHSQRNIELELLIEEVQEYLDTHCEKDAQGSADWHTAREKSFGGSDMAGLMGLDSKRYKTQKRFIAEKIQPAQFTGYQQILLDWGKLFEPIHRAVLEDLLNCQIFESGMIKGLGLFSGCHQSPDGIGVLCTSYFREHVDYSACQSTLNAIQGHLKVLFELKSPCLRQPSPGEMPDNYIAQVKLGLALFRVCDIGCYSESKFRICTSEQWTTAQFNTSIIKEPKDSREDPEPLYVGICTLADSYTEPGDCGSMDKKLFAGILSHIEGFEIYKYRDTRDAVKKTKLLQAAGKSFFCWKLVFLQQIAVERSLAFNRVIQAFVAVGQECINNPESDPKPIEQLQQLSKTLKLAGFPLQPENAQDQWLQTRTCAFVDSLMGSEVRSYQYYRLLLTVIRESAYTPGRTASGMLLETALKCMSLTDEQIQELRDIVTDINTELNLRVSK